MSRAMVRQLRAELQLRTKEEEVHVVRLQAEGRINGYDPNDPREAELLLLRRKNRVLRASSILQRAFSGRLAMPAPGRVGAPAAAKPSTPIGDLDDEQKR